MTLAVIPWHCNARRNGIIHDDGVTAEDLEPQRRGCTERRLAQDQNIEGIPRYALRVIVEPLEPIGIDRGHRIPHPVKFDEIARHVLLRYDVWNSAPGKAIQCFL